MKKFREAEEQAIKDRMLRGDMPSEPDTSGGSSSYFSDEYGSESGSYGSENMMEAVSEEGEVDAENQDLVYNVRVGN
eukprot:CAMPEP_0170497270 /NCGR_PEP_ID=MMETSP0208-20121228/24250_1 /TAXON_ID=197538 /ORGANISM="Strombidium inclinatum, Strain S3" /LENGTH=76 /DNA_ID=CAMNT_0010774041 /DNA_START=255 /DNA_END=485 /DNA_ORIENTATION=+